MATRSTIAIEYTNGWVEQIYCHWDGYLEHTGRILQEHYTDPAKVAQLMRLGDLSSLGAELGEPHDFASREHDTWCKSYHRDRGELLMDTQAREFIDYQTYLDSAQSEEFNYILRSDGVWYVSHDGSFVPLADELKVVDTDEE